MGFSDEVGLLFRAKFDTSDAIAGLGNLRGAVKSGVQGIAQDFAASAGGVGTFAASLGPVGLAVGATVGVLATLGAAATAATVKAVELGSRFNDLSIQTGLSVETLSGLESQLKQSGTSADALGNTVLFMHKNLGQAAEGNKELKQTFAELGIKDVNAALRDTDGTLRTVIKSLGDLTSEGERDRLGTEALGRGYKDLRVFISDTKGDIEETLKAAREAGLMMSGEVAGNLDRLGDSYDSLSYKASVMSANFVGTVAPEIAKGLDDIGMALSANVANWEQWSLGAAIAAARVRGVMEGAAQWWNGDTWSPWKLGEAIGQGADNAEIGAVTDYLLNKANPPKARPRSSGVTPRRGGGGGGKSKASDGRMKDLQSDERDVDADFRRESEALERDYRRRLDTLSQFTEQELALLGTWIKEKRDIFDSEEKEVARSTKNEAERERKLREIQQKRTAAEDEYHRRVNAANDKRADEQRKADEANNDKRLKLAEATARARIASVERAVDAEVKTESQGADEIGRIRLDLNTKQAARLRERLAQEEEGSAEYRRIQAELGESEIERAQIVEETAHRVAQAKKAEVEAERQMREALRRLRAEAIAEQLDAERMEIEVGAARNRFPSRSERIDNIRARAANDRGTEEARHAAALEQLRNEREEILAKVKNFDDFLEVETTYHLKREAEARRHAAEMQGINQRQKQDEDEESPFKAFKDLWGEFESNSKNAGDSVKDSVGEMSVSVVGSLQNMRGALEQGIKAHILYGASIGKAIKQAAAEELAGISARATIKGMEHAAYAIGSLAFGNFGAAAKHGAASAAFFALAAATGVAARALAGSASGSGSTAGDAVASTGAQAERDRTIIEGRRGGSHDPNQPTVRVIIEDRSRIESGILRDRMVQIIGSDGRVQDAVVSQVSGAMENGRMSDALDHGVTHTWNRMGRMRDTIMSGTVGTAGSF